MTSNIALIGNFRLPYTTMPSTPQHAPPLVKSIEPLPFVRKSDIRRREREALEQKKAEEKARAKAEKAALRAEKAARKASEQAEKTPRRRRKKPHDVKQRIMKNLQGLSKPAGSRSVGSVGAGSASEITDAGKPRHVLEFQRKLARANQRAEAETKPKKRRHRSGPAEGAPAAPEAKKPRVPVEPRGFPSVETPFRCRRLPAKLVTSDQLGTEQYSYRENRPDRPFFNPPVTSPFEHFDEFERAEREARRKRRVSVP